MVAVAQRGGAHGGGVRPGIGFRLREAGELLAPDHRHQVVLARRTFELVEDRAHRRPEDVDGARRQRRRSRDLAPHDDLCHHAEPEPAEFLGHVVEPEAERLRLAAQALGQLLLQLDVVDDLAFERDQFAVDETPHVLLQQAQLFRQLEVHPDLPVTTIVVRLFAVAAADRARRICRADRRGRAACSRGRR